MHRDAMTVYECNKLVTYQVESEHGATNAEARVKRQLLIYTSSGKKVKKMLKGNLKSSFIHNLREQWIIKLFVKIMYHFNIYRSYSVIQSHEILHSLIEVKC